MTVKRYLLALAVLLGGLTLPAAALMQPANYRGSPTATLADTNRPTPAYEPTPEEVGNQIAQATWKRNAAHFKCKRYPQRRRLQPSDLVPTANVSATIQFDSHTGSYEVTTVDPRIIIGYQTKYKNSRFAGKTFVIDQYNWSYAKGVEPYGVITRSVDRDGNEYWSRLNPRHRADGASVMDLYRGGDRVEAFIVATDTRTCEPGNSLSVMWPHIHPNLLF